MDKKEQTTRFRYDPGFAPIPYSAMRNAAVSIEARGLLALMMTHSQNWEFNRKDLMKKAGCSKGKYDRMIRELKDAGYLRVTTAQDSSGKISGYIYDIDPTPETDGSKNRPSVKPTVGESTPIRKEIEKERKEKDSPLTPQGGATADNKSENPINWNDVDPQKGTFAYMVPDEKYALPKPFFAGKKIFDYAIIELRLKSEECRDAKVSFQEYWWDKSNRKNGKKTPRGWEAAFKTWLRKDASSLKAQYRPQPFDYRENEQKEDGDPTEEFSVREIPDEYWRLHVQKFVDEDRWEAVGPPPNELECQAPEAILQKYGFGIDRGN